MKHFLFGIFAAVGLSTSVLAQGYDTVSDARDALLAGDYEAAFAVIEPAAASGHPRALNLMGAVFKDGVGRPQDTAQALALFEKAAASNYGPALFNLGLIYETGAPGLEPDPERAEQYYLRGVELDYAAAMGAFGQFMLRQGRSDDLPLLIDVLERGATLGDPRSLLILGFLTRDGQGIEADLERARDLLHAAALLGERQAMREMATFFEADDNDLADPAEARKFWRRLAEAGDPEAQNRMGEIYALGQNVDVDMDEAVKWLEAAAAQGHMMANNAMGHTLRDGPNGYPVNPERARGYFARAAELGHPGSFGNHGIMVYLGEGGLSDHALAAQIYADGVVAGDPYSMNNLAEMTRQGEGVPQDLQRARALYQMAADAGHAPAMSNLGVMYQRGLGGPQELDVALELYLEAGTLGDIQALHNAAMIILDHRDLFGDQQLAGLGLCLWVLEHARDPERGAYQSSCEAHYDRFTEADAARARALIDAL